MAGVIFALSVLLCHAPVVAQMILFLVDDLDDLIMKQVVGKAGPGRIQFAPCGGSSTLMSSHLGTCIGRFCATLFPRETHVLIGSIGAYPRTRVEEDVLICSTR